MRRNILYSLLKDLAHIPSASAVDQRSSVVCMRQRISAILCFASCRMDSYAVAWRESTVYVYDLRTRSMLLNGGFGDLKNNV
jgi:hypothetical protein